MPIALAGISNENEFYSEHYLTTVFEGDIEETFAAWREAEKAGGTPPNRRLAKVGTVWRRLSAQYLDERSDQKRLLIAREFAHEFLDALGYERRSELLPDAEEKLVPVLARRALGNGEDQVWVVEVPSPGGADFETDPLQVRFRCEQFENIETALDIARRRKDTAEVAVTRGVFGLAEPPRFVLLLSLSQAVLIDRRKWPDSRLLRFQFAEIFGRSEGATLGVTAALLHADSLAPGSGTPLIDRIDEESHRHAFGVSQDLKFALRKAIEILGNEAAELIVAKRRANKEGVFSGENLLDADRLTTECLRYMYRLLFLFFIEARPELGFAPMKAKAYRTGYSLESLRELELVPLETEEDREGHYISDTLDALFALVFEGTPAARSEGEAFTFHAVRARLFDPDAIGTYLGGLRFRNEKMQQVIELLSLSRGERGRGRGRISYAQLGISQLGAVYESLLSFSGFFATEDLIELKPAGKPAPGPLEAAFFAPKRRAGDFVQGATPLEGEFVYDDNVPRTYPRGTFIYRLAGRNRENSASYYTPEPLARVLVKYALKELLAGKTADDILELKVVEPAMGSAAFLVEVVNQLADRYLELKQAEVGQRIPHESYAYERQKVRAFLADRNVFGVDLNPVAVELGQVSLWLNCLHAGGFAPWFEDQVHAGNSLVGARRAVFPGVSLTARKEEDRWYSRKPREIGWSGENRAPDEVWHFLLPDPGMCAYDVNIVRPLAPDDWKTMAEWRKDFVRPLDADEAATVRRLSATVDTLFEDVADRLHEMRGEVNDDITIWPSAPRGDERHVDFQEKIRRLATFQGQGVRNSVAWRRLRAAMDAWCALWFWPVDKAGLLPSRTKFFQDLDLVLTQGVEGQSVTINAFATGSPQGRLFETITLPAEKGASVLFRAEERVVDLRRDDLFSDVDVDKLIAASPWMPTAMNVASSRRFMHFDLEFADVMRERRGFDLVIGNPPWLKPTWIDAHVLSEQEPIFGIREAKAAVVEKSKLRILRSNEGAERRYLNDYVEVGGLQSFLASPTCYPHLGGGQANLYKGFIDLTFRITSKDGCGALIHQDNHLTDPDGSNFRKTWYSRVKSHYHFRNSITRRMFAEVKDRKTFSLNVYRGSSSEVKFDHIASLLLPSMVDECYEHDGVGPVPGLRKQSGGWDTRGHKKRIVSVDERVLRVFSSVIEDEGKLSTETRFLYPFSIETLDVFRQFANGKVTFSEEAQPFQMKPLWHESGSSRGGTIKDELSFPASADQAILTGSLLHVGNPFFKCPDSTGRKEIEVDLSETPDIYYTRNYFAPGVEKMQYKAAITRLNWDHKLAHTEPFRIALRRRLDVLSERTLVAALIPPGVAHVDSIESIAFKNEETLLSALPLWMSLPFDFIVKATGLSDFRESSLRFFPWVNVGGTAIQRALRLNCLTSSYEAIWNRHASELKYLAWSSDDARLAIDASHDSACKSPWTREAAIRTDFARRMALVEIDVLVAQALELSLDQLIEIYRTQFHVLDENERNTWYDAHGKIVWTSSKSVTGIGWRKKDGKKPTGREWEDMYANLPAGEQLECDQMIDFLPSGKTKVRRTYKAPFVTCDREADYRRAWAFFASHEQRQAA
ncbi:hypothetical protein [Methylobacterium radiodurans]|uniref:site-specific DNA-methyltransferase (adenine-specific) n=1 Tax=Methylobacterium radiodurans TaxID=2202828 RepID=A0A2U8VLH2_9HYPH|nr:hypothetical protein [Methylobacterium radiodurans]AWN34400.1 hypothetical protein DK427_00440 [Methylobacterium radiodurans]